MTQAIVTKPAVYAKRSPLGEVKTCSTCPHFNDFHEENGRGWCNQPQKAIGKPEIAKAIANYLEKAVDE